MQKNIKWFVYVKKKQYLCRRKGLNPFKDHYDYEKKYRFYHHSINMSDGV